MARGQAAQGRPPHPRRRSHAFSQYWLRLLASSDGVPGQRPAVLAGALASGARRPGLGRRKLGGYTGDVLGAAAVAAETAGLIMAAGKW